MSDMREIMFLVYDGFELLDLAGPSSVFNAANTITACSCYAVSVHSALGGKISSSCGIEIATERLPSAGSLDSSSTVLVVGAEGIYLTNAMKNAEIRGFLQMAATAAGRCGSVCSGAFVLASSGVLDGRRAATHWAGCDIFSRWFPQVQLNREALYICDGPIWTSAGVSTGIDMALSMVSQDYGAKLKGQISGYLVVYAHRPGYQNQFSSMLSIQINAETPLGTTMAWLEANLHQTISVEDLAGRCGMSVRSFHRRIAKATGQTPARFLLILRMEKAKQFLAKGQSVKSVASQVGFASETAFRIAFKNYVGILPSHFASTQYGAENGIAANTGS